MNKLKLSISVAVLGLCMPLAAQAHDTAGYNGIAQQILHQRLATNYAASGHSYDYVNQRPHVKHKAYKARHNNGRWKSHACDRRYKKVKKHYRRHHHDYD